MGYIGSVLLLIINLVLIMNPGWVFPLASKAEEFMKAGFSAEQALQKAKDFYGLIAIKLSFVSVGIWWAGFAQITFNNLKEYPKKDQAEKQNYLKKGFHELQKVFKEIKQSKSGRFSNFLIGYFFASMGIQTVMYVASLFGSLELKMGTSELIVTILIIQLIAIVGAKLFAIISSKIGNIYSLLMMLLIWIGITIGAYFVQSSLQFYALAGVVGVVMGGIQSMFRSTFAKIIPEHTSDHASYFSFYDVCEKLATVLGTFVFAFINNMTGNMRSSVLVLMVFFLVGLFFISRIKNFIGKVA
jgi:UMF1 family MFS transporter